MNWTRPHSPTYRVPGIPLALLAAMTSCGSRPRPEPDPAIEQEFLAEAKHKAEVLARNRDFQRRLLRLDQALALFAKNAAHGEDPKARAKAKSLGRFLEKESLQLRKELLPLLEEGEVRGKTIAAAALGFTGEQDLAPALVACLESSREPQVRTACLLGIGRLASPLTPLEPLTRILLDERAPLIHRRNASWALLRILDGGAKNQGFLELWKRILEGDPLSKDPVIAMHALRGLGLLRNPEALPALRPYLAHPKALIRETALIAIGRSGDPSAAAYILPLIGDLERNPNVRLTARKALKALAGGEVDEGYDQQAWRQRFGLKDS